MGEMRKFFAAVAPKSQPALAKKLGL